MELEEFDSGSQVEWRMGFGQDGGNAANMESVMAGVFIVTGDDLERA